MALTLVRRVLMLSMPPGAIWRAKRHGNMDNFHEGLALKCSRVVHDNVAVMSNVRNPALTPVLSDLEMEFGVAPSDEIFWKLLAVKF